VSGRTALHYAAWNGHSELVSILLSQNANVNAQDSEGTTALHLACMDGHVAVIQCLLGNRARIDLVTSAAKSAYDLAHDDIVRDLLRSHHFGQISGAHHHYHPPSFANLDTDAMDVDPT